MTRHDRIACLLLGLAVLAGSLPDGAPAGAPPSEHAGVPAAPQWVGGTDVRGKAQLTWIRSPAFAAVRVYRRDEGAQGPFRLMTESKENVWVDDTVQPGRTYRYRLAGIGLNGVEGRTSAELAVRIAVVVVRPTAPPDWEGYLVVEDGVGLKWAAREGEDVLAWNVYRRSPPDTEFRLVGSSRGTSYHDTSLDPDRQYVYALTALDSSFRETPLSRELSVTFTRTRAPVESQRPAAAWLVRRTRLVATVGGGGGLTFERPADVAVGRSSGRVYVADSGRNLVFIFSLQGVYQGTLGAGSGGQSAFKNLLGLAVDNDENLYAVDAGTGTVQKLSPQGHPSGSVELPRRAGATGLIDAAVGPAGRVYIVDNYNSQISSVGREGVRSFGRAGAKGGEFSAPTFCDVDAAGNLYVADCLNARVQVFTAAGEFVRAFGRAERGPGGFGRPKGVAVSAAGEVYVADSWLNTVQVFDAEGRFVAVLGDEKGRPLDLGSPNGVALGPGNRVYVAERLSARLQIRELIDLP